LIIFALEVAEGQILAQAASTQIQQVITGMGGVSTRKASPE
jgi:hypothetical protein